MPSSALFVLGCLFIGFTVFDLLRYGGLDGNPTRHMPFTRLMFNKANLVCGFGLTVVGAAYLIYRSYTY